MKKYSLDISSQETGRSSTRIRFTGTGSEPNEGELEVIQLREGLSISIDRSFGRRRENVSFEIINSPIQFGFLLRGRIRTRFNQDRFERKDQEMPEGSNGISFLPKTSGVMEREVAESLCAVTIILDPTQLRQIVDACRDDLPKEILHIAEERQDKPFIWYGADMSSKRMAVHRFIDCPLHGGFKKLFFDGLAVELICTQLYECSMGLCRTAPSVKLTPDDIDRIRMARDLLVRDVENPPIATELAQAVGLSEIKLKRGFSSVFGFPIYSYFRDYRLDKAREYLEAGEMNVSEAAYRIGYLSLGHFSKAFFDRFGVVPRDLLREHRELRVTKKINAITKERPRRCRT